MVHVNEVWWRPFPTNLQPPTHRISDSQNLRPSGQTKNHLPFPEPLKKVVLHNKECGQCTVSVHGVLLMCQVNTSLRQCRLALVHRRQHELHNMCSKTMAPLRGIECPVLLGPDVLTSVQSLLFVSHSMYFCFISKTRTSDIAVQVAARSGVNTDSSSRSNSVVAQSSSRSSHSNMVLTLRLVNVALRLHLVVARQTSPYHLTSI